MDVQHQKIIHSVSPDGQNTSTISTTARRHHTDLQPLRTRVETLLTPTRKQSIHSLGPPSASTVTLSSPSVVVARAYYLERSPIGPKTNATPRRRSLIENQQVPRRHSVLPTTGNLATRLESFNFSSAGHELQAVLEGDEPRPRIKTQSSQNGKSKDISIDDTSKLEQAPMRWKSDLCGTPQDILRQVPFQYTHDHLRNWGYAYLGNSATADAFVNAVSLRRPSLALVKEDESQVKTSDLITIRARVLPKAPERKPFLIQRQFDIEEQRRNIPKIQESRRGSDSTLPRRSSRLRRSSAQNLQKKLSQKGTGKSHSEERNIVLGKGAIPIQYALHYLPVLAALMLSGHVRKGDTIDLPIPRPGAWRDVVTYIYTGSGPVTSPMRETILYLAGHAD